jgi:hypothetical protein
MSDIILLVFEGESAEPNIFNNIKKVFFNKNKKTILYAIWGCDIGSLYQEVKKDEYLDIFSLLQRRNENLKNLKRNQISQIYMFFDFEGKIFKNKTLEEYCDILEDMLEKFNNETEQGKLYISYPMVEALRHAKKDLSKNDLKCVWNIYEKKHYKTHVHEITDYANIHKWNFMVWQLLISLCVQKAYCLVYKKWKIPEYKEINALNQNKILSSQKDRFIKSKHSVISLSAFSFFILNYFGEVLYKKLKSHDYEKGCRFRCIVEEERVNL